MILRELIQGGFGISCFKSVMCVEFCLLELFQYRPFASQYMALTLIYTFQRIQTSQTYTHSIVMLSEGSSSYLRAIQDNNRY